MKEQVTHDRSANAPGAPIRYLRQARNDRRFWFCCNKLGVSTDCGSSEHWISSFVSISSGCELQKPVLHRESGRERCPCGVASKINSGTAREVHAGQQEELQGRLYVVDAVPARDVISGTLSRQQRSLLAAESSTQMKNR